MAKPRTNADAAEYWARSILSEDPPDPIDVNSVGVKVERLPLPLGANGEPVYGSRTVVTSFSWYPMGVILRDEHGVVRRVVVNADRYPSRGFASTPTDQWNVTSSAKTYVDQLNAERGGRERVAVEELPLSDSHLPGPSNRLQVRPTPSDPEPCTDFAIRVPPFFNATNPGPEPVKDPHGCVAGTIEEYEYVQTEHLHSDPQYALDDQAYTVRMDGDYGISYRMRPADVTHVTERGTMVVERSYTGSLVYGSAAYARDSTEVVPFRSRPTDPYAGLKSGITYMQCHHCAAFDVVHKRWSDRMYGPPWGRGRGKGWQRYCEMIAEHGSEDGWRDARREALRERRRRLAEHGEWVERNFIPLSAVSKDRWRLPLLPDGYAMRKDAAAHFKSEREAARRKRALQRDMERRARERAAVERFAARMRARRRPSFESLAAEAAANLASLHRSDLP
jgi:hypothetical protein